MKKTYWHVTLWQFTGFWGLSMLNIVEDLSWTLLSNKKIAKSTPGRGPRAKWRVRGFLAAQSALRVFGLVAFLRAAWEARPRLSALAEAEARTFGIFFNKNLDLLDLKRKLFSRWLSFLKNFEKIVSFCWNLGFLILDLPLFSAFERRFAGPHHGSQVGTPRVPAEAFRAAPHEAPAELRWSLAETGEVGEKPGFYSFFFFFLNTVFYSL